MTIPNGPENEPLWLSIEKEISKLGSHDLAQDNLEKAIQGVAQALDSAGSSVSTNAGHMLALRSAVRDRVDVGRPLMEDLNKTFGSLTLDGLTNPYDATATLIGNLGTDWPAFKNSERRPHIQRMVEDIRLDLLVAKADEIGGDGGVRFLIESEVDSDIIVERLGISQEEYDRVLAEVEAERAERERVSGLIQDAEGKPEADLIRHLMTSDVAESLIVEMAQVDQASIDSVKKAMEEEIAQKQRLAEEAAAKKAAEAAGPSLEDIPPDEMLEHIDALREILDFSDVEKEIRVMCEQSGVPKDLMEIALSDPDRLDDLEAEAEG